MLRVLGLMRHGLAAGQAPGAELLPEGVVYLRQLAARLDADRWRPAVIVTSPYVRARASAAVIASALALPLVPIMLEELLPEAEPADALAAIREAAPLATPILVVTHLPLVGRLAQELVGDDLGFAPGAFAEIVRDGDGGARLLRHITPRDLTRG